MGTSIVRDLTSEEVARLPRARQQMFEAGANGATTLFTYFAAFDGTNNDKSNLTSSGDAFTTNIGQLDLQANQATESSQNIRSKYFPGVGTGGDQGGLANAAFLPTSAINAAAEKAYTEFSDAAIQYLNGDPGASPSDIGVATTGFSRGCATAIRFAQLVNDRGLMDPSGKEIAPPGSVPITGMALIDPVASFVEGPMHLPQNVRGQVLTVMAEHENRRDFRPLYYGDDPRVTTVLHPGNHVGVGGGYDRHGTAANVLEGVTGYFQRRGIALADVPPDRKHDPAQPQHLYTEAFATARNGDVLPRKDGAPVTRWRLDDAHQGRIEVRPQMPAAHVAWLKQLERDVGPGLREAGLTSEQCQVLAVACARRSGQDGAQAPPQRLLLSNDQQRVAWVDGQERLVEVRIDRALSESAPTSTPIQAPQQQTEAMATDRPSVARMEEPARAR